MVAETLEHLSSILEVDFAQLSEAGKKPENQDTLGAKIPDGTTLTTKGMAFVTADGVSSSDAARQASQTAVSGFLTDYFATPDTWSTNRSAERVIKSLNHYLWGQSRNSIYGQGHLTTFTALILKGSTAFSFHIGDSRLQRIRNNDFEELTRDHSQRMNQDTVYLSRALGADISVDIDSLSFELSVGDIYILTSDGVHDYLKRNDWLSLANEFSTNKDTWARKALDLALERGSQDNQSIQIVEIKQLGAATETEVVTALKQLPFPPPLTVGNKIDGLKVEKILHESERSQVYLVRDENDKLLVMKTPSLNYDDDTAYIERFVMESWVGARISSPYVVRVVTPKARSYLYYLTEHVSGPTLAQLIKERHPIPIRDTVEIIDQVIKGVRAFHRKDTLHQDIKPGNIVIGHGGAIKIIDFGSAWVAGIDELKVSFERDIILGTLDYSAPEYRYGGKVGHLSDQFSIAVLVYEMLTGKAPYGSSYRDAKDLKHFQKLQYNSALRHNPLVPQWIDRALEKALAIEPEARYNALSEFIQDLKRPNPAWLTPRERPLMQRNPLIFWQTLAGLGWLAFVVALIMLLQ